MSEVNSMVKALSLSIKNQQHFASMVDYYGSKLKRFDRFTQQLYLLCYLRERVEKNLERLADGFVYHTRKVHEQAKVYAKDAAYRDWEGAAANISKAAELLHLFIDDSIDDKQPFGAVKWEAQKLLKSCSKAGILSHCVCTSISKKECLMIITGNIMTNKKPLLEKVLRPIFLCLTFQATHKTQALATQLAITKSELSVGSTLHTMDRRLIRPTQGVPVDKEGNVVPNRFEWLLYYRFQTS